MDIESTRQKLGSELRVALLRLAGHQDDLAAAEAAAIPYWGSCPPSVLGHREAASALRAQAEALLAAS